MNYFHNWTYVPVGKLPARERLIKISASNGLSSFIKDGGIKRTENLQFRRFYSAISTMETFY